MLATPHCLSSCSASAKLNFLVAPRPSHVQRAILRRARSGNRCRNQGLVSLVTSHLDNLKQIYFRCSSRVSFSSEVDDCKRRYSSLSGGCNFASKEPGKKCSEELTWFFSASKSVLAMYSSVRQRAKETNVSIFN